MPSVEPVREHVSLQVPSQDPNLQLNNLIQQQRLDGRFFNQLLETIPNCTKLSRRPAATLGRMMQPTFNSAANCTSHAIKINADGESAFGYIKIFEGAVGDIEAAVSTIGSGNKIVEAEMTAFNKRAKALGVVF